MARLWPACQRLAAMAPPTIPWCIAAKMHADRAPPSPPSEEAVRPEVLSFCPRGHPLGGLAAPPSRRTPPGVPERRAPGRSRRPIAQMDAGACSGPRVRSFLAPRPRQSSETTLTRDDTGEGRHWRGRTLTRGTLTSFGPRRLPSQWDGLFCDRNGLAVAGAGSGCHASNDQGASFGALRGGPATARRAAEDRRQPERHVQPVPAASPG